MPLSTAPSSRIDDFISRMPAQRVIAEGPWSEVHRPGYAAASLAFVTACVLRWALDDHLPAGFPFLTFFPAVVLISFIYGKYPGIAISLASAMASWLLFIPGHALDKLLPIGFFAAIVTIDILIIDVMHRALHRASVVQKKAIALAEEREIVVGELGHRIKNLITNVLSLINFAARGAPDMPSLVSRVRDRLMALGRVSSVLQQGVNVSIVKIADIVLLSTEPVANASALEIDRESLSALVSSADANPLSMIFHELATNSIKYGALGKIAEGAKVRVTGEKLADGHLVEWRETGFTRELVDRKTEKGFGSELIARLSAAMGAEVETELKTSGFVFRLRLPGARIYKTSMSSKADSSPPLRRPDEEAQRHGQS